MAPSSMSLCRRASATPPSRWAAPPSTSTATSTYVTNYGRNRLFRNRGGCTFDDITALAGVGDERWGAGAAFGDYDFAGDLDL